MLTPSIFRNNFFDSFFDDPFDDFFKVPARGTKPQKQVPFMKTDIKETDAGYELEIDLPGFQKDQIELTLENGYLNVAAETKNSVDDQDENGKYIHRERYTGRCSRSFYVGDLLKEEDVKAGFENGILKIAIPKKEPEKVVEEKKTIAIEG